MQLPAWEPGLNASKSSCRKGAIMLQTGKAVKVSIYLSDGAKHHGVPVYTSLLDFLFHNGISGATVLKGVAGFGAAHRVHSAHILDISDQLPVKIEFIESPGKVEAVLEELQKRIDSGLIEVQETSVIVPPRP
jgi:PII-like signaling protein